LESQIRSELEETMAREVQVRVRNEVTDQVTQDLKDSNEKALGQMKRKYE